MTEMTNAIDRYLNEQADAIGRRLTIKEVDDYAAQYKAQYAYKGDDLRVNRARDLSIQSRATQDDVGGGGSNILSRLVRAGNLISPWWSRQRDIELRKFWKQGNHLSGAVRAFTSKIATIDFRIVPKDTTISRQVQMADEAQESLLEASEYGAGWNIFISKWIQDLVTTDNGAFAEIIGAGSPTGPIIGRPVALAHLDSCRCRRTRSAEYPVVYQDTNGKWYKFHYTRVLMASQMASSDVQMNGVGFSSCSSALDTAQGLIDIARYKQEKLGSRPVRQMLVGKNISAEEILNAFYMANESMDNQGLGRYAKMVAIGNPRKEVSIDQLDLASIPDGFDEETSTTLGMFAIALAFEMDARELWPTTVSGATKADAMIQHLKARRKGAGQAMQLLARQLNQKYLPATLTFTFDIQDDEQDMLQADVRDRRSIYRERDINDGSITIRVTREQALHKGDITDAQFEQMELEDGRLADGTDVLALFFSPDSEIKALLSLNLDNPLQINDNDAEVALREIDLAINRALEAIINLNVSGQKARARQSLAALERLREMYAGDEESDEEEEEGELESPEVTDADRERIRNEDDYDGEGVRDVVERM